ncbi:MAG: class I SAM-dependent methyltransferase [Myxococcales bacterium]|nr:class I SAM-dependent methyltransferase [Myxococcales bacterium]
MGPSTDNALVAEALVHLGYPEEGAVSILAPFVQLVRTWSRRMNLTGARTDRDLVDVLLTDAIVLARQHWLPQGGSFVDVGSGGGTPAIPLLLLRSDLRGTLVEPLRKRVTFLRTCAGQLGLSNRMKVIEGRIDPDTPQLADAPFDVALSRATFEPETWLRIGSSLAPRTVVFVGSERSPDLPDPQDRTRYNLPFGGSPRELRLFDRALDTPTPVP